MKKLLLLSGLIAILFSSCLKDNSRFVDFAANSNFVNMPLSGLANFGADAVTADTAVIKFAVSYATVNPNAAITVTLAVDPTIVTSYNAANPTGIQYALLPSSAYSFTNTNLTIPAGAQYVFTTITINKYLLDPSQSYMLPVKIASTSAGQISGNLNVHYFHVIGNVLAGAYTHSFYRYNNFSTPPPAGTTPSGGSFYGASAQTAIFQPISPSEIYVVSGYYLQTTEYDFTFTATGSGASTVFSNQAISLLASDVARDFTPNGISVTQPPVIQSADYVNKVFTFQYTVQNSSGYRWCVDTYVHQ